MKTCKSYTRDGKGNDGRTAGPEENLDNLLRRNAGQAYELAYSLAGNREEAKELVQEASYRVLLNWGRYDPLKSFQSWYLTMLKNIFIDSRRRLSGRCVVSLDATIGDDEGQSLAEAVADGTPGFFEQMERAARIEAARQSLKALSNAYRAVLTLCDLEGMSYEDAAQRLGLPLGTVRSRLFRARAAMMRDPRIRGLA